MWVFGRISLTSVQYSSLKIPMSLSKTKSECNAIEGMQCATMNKITVISFNFLVALVDKKYVGSTYFVHLMFALMDYNHFKPTAGVPAELSNHKPLPRRLFQVSPG